MKLADDLVADQWLATPVLRDEGNEPMFDAVPLAGATRVMGDSNGNSGLVVEGLQFASPQVKTKAVSTPPLADERNQTNIERVDPVGSDRATAVLYLRGDLPDVANRWTAQREARTTAHLRVRGSGTRLSDKISGVARVCELPLHRVGQLIVGDSKSEIALAQQRGVKGSVSLITAFSCQPPIIAIVALFPVHQTA